MTIKSLLQATLDSELAADGVFSWWQRRGDSEEWNGHEYIVYTVDSDRPSMRADGSTFSKSANIVVRYYHNFALSATLAGTKQISEREKQIGNLLEKNGFHVISGPSDVGDIDDVGFNTTLFECESTRLFDGQVEEFFRDKDR